MKKAKKNMKESITKSGLNFILFCSILITVFFNSTLKDPFNTPKFILLIILGSWCFGVFLVLVPILKNNQSYRSIFILFIIFNSISLISSLSSSNKYASFIGEFQRKNGFLTYLSLSLVFLVVITMINAHSIQKIYFSIFLTAAIVSSYGFIQHFGKDFIAWNNPYNSVISTVGNPNFASAIMSVFAVVITGYALNNENGKLRRLFGIFVASFLLLVIFFSNSRQGLIAFIAGTLALICIYLFKRNRNIGIAALSSAAILGLIAILGMLQKGPLTDLLYKPSVTLRGYYWKAGIKMLSEHPLLGVGPDRFGAFFKSVRPAEYPVKYGFDITSTNAHNVPIQLFSTLGFLGGLTYLVIVGYVFLHGIDLIKNNRVSFKLTAPIFSGWIAFQSQSLISIDNIGIAIWGWLLSGVIIGLSISSQRNAESQIAIKLYNQPGRSLLSAFFVFIAFIFSTFLYRGETYMFKQAGLVNVQGQEGLDAFHTVAIETLSVPLLDPQYRLETAYNLAYKGYAEESLMQVNNVLKKDPRSQDGLTLKAMAYEAKNELEGAIKVRLEITKLDPWNAKNYLKIGQLYKLVGNQSGAYSMLNKILSFAPNTAEAAQAKNELIIK